jgi:kynurenine formamidase
MPVFPGTDSPSFVEKFSLAQNGFNEMELKLLTHTGTHLDCPAHMISSEITTDTANLSSFYGSAFVADFSNKKLGEQISKEDLLIYSKALKKQKIILIYTGFDKYWGTADYFLPFPTLNIDAIQFLIENNIKLIGLDVISIDSIDAQIYKNHYLALENNIIIVENLCNLDKLIDKKFNFAAFPLKIKNGDGSPVRAVAIFNE